MRFLGVNRDDFDKTQLMQHHLRTLIFPKLLKLLFLTLCANSRS